MRHKLLLHANLFTDLDVEGAREDFLLLGEREDEEGFNDS